MLEIRFASIKEWTSEKEKEYLKILPEDRQKEIMSLKREKARRQSLTGEYLVRTMLSNKLKCPGNQFLIARNFGSKPELLGVPLFFNISHSVEYVMAGISDSPIGVDIEWVGHDASRAIWRVCCSKEEAAYINEEEKKKKERMTEVWTRKEALVKCIGSGVFDSAMKENVGTGETIVEIKENKKRYLLLPWEAPEEYRCSVCLCLSE